MSTDERLHTALTDLLDKVSLDRDACRRLAKEIGLYAGLEGADRPVIALMAIDLERYYSAIEATLEAVAKTLDGGVPSGADWHSRLLDQMQEASETRPAVLTQHTRSMLDALLRFRHFMRHAYAVELDWAKIRGLATRLPGLHASLEREIADFQRFLESCLAVRSAPDD